MQAGSPSEERFEEEVSSGTCVWFNRLREREVRGHVDMDGQRLAVAADHDFDGL